MIENVSKGEDRNMSKIKENDRKEGKEEKTNRFARKEGLP